MREVVTQLPQRGARPLDQRLARARAQRFVGRAAELESCRALISADSPRRALFFHGLGGVGKTSLLDACAQAAESLGVPVRRLDLRDFAQAGALEQALAEAPPPAPLWVLLLDTCERLGGAQEALFRRWLPQLPDSVRIVLAGRAAPALEWQTDPGWREAMQVCELKNLSDMETRELLRGLEVPPARHDAALRFTRGHPLAVTLVAGAGEPNEVGDDDPRVVAALLRRFLADVPDTDHRHAVEASCYARVTTEAVLRLFFEPDRAHTLYEWLAGLPFMELGRDGLFPHDLVREVVDAELRKRDPERYEFQHWRIGRHYIEQSTRGKPFDLLFMHRASPLMNAVLDWNTVGDITSHPARPEDAAQLRDCVARHEGARSAELCAAWFKLQPEGFTIFHDVNGVFRGFLAYLALDVGQLTAPPATEDPAFVAAARLFGKGRTRERFGIVRWWIAENAYHQPGPMHSAMIAHLTELWLSASDNALELLPQSRPEFWKAQMKYVDFHHLPDADFSIDGRNYTVYGHDWRITGLADWLDSFEVRRARLKQFKTVVQTPPPPPREEFDRWLRDALRDAGRPDRLGSSPLCRLATFAGCPDPAAAVREWLQQGIAALDAGGKGKRLAQVLDVTYLSGCPSQEAAAERLNLAFGTYRHRLRAAEAALAEALWPQLRITSQKIEKPGPKA